MWAKVLRIFAFFLSSNMQKEIEDKLHEVYEEVIEGPQRVQEIFNDFYGEERVDLQGIPTYDYFKETIENINVTYMVINHYGELMSRVPSEVKPVIETIIRKVNPVRFMNSPELITLLLPHCIDYLQRALSATPFLLVHFPKVRVTNEYDRFVDIKDLYAKVPITINGESTGTVMLNRSTYPISHLRSNYMHSHVPGLNLNNLGQFKNVCMGTGPIRATITNLSREFDSDLWQLFCLELDRFTRVESLRGGPYRKLEGIGNCNSDSAVPMYFHQSSYNAAGVFTKEDFTGFIKWLLRRKVLKFTVCPTGFAIADPYYNIMLKLSNEFIKYWNTKISAHTTKQSLCSLVKARILMRYLFRDGRLYNYLDSSGRTYEEFEGTTMFTFKGNDVKFHIEPEVSNDNENVVLWLSDSLAQEVLKSILEILNYNYGREERKEKEVTPTCQGRYYL